jgi:hypothetical protein
MKWTTENPTKAGYYWFGKDATSLSFLVLIVSSENTKTGYVLCEVGRSHVLSTGLYIGE